MRNRILFVDDESDWIRTVGTFLKLSGYRVVTARNTLEALLQADGGDLGAIILDVNLAGEDTAQLLERLQAQHPEAPVILYTGLEPDDKRVQHLLGRGADHCLHKGSLKELLNLLRDISQESGCIQSGPALAPAGAWQMV